MKKVSSSQSLINMRRTSLSNLLWQQKESFPKQKLTQKCPIPAPIIKTIDLHKNNNTSHKIESKKGDFKQIKQIKQIYEYKIKEQALKSKLKKPNQLQHQSSPNQITFCLQDERTVDCLKIQNQKMQKELHNMSKENKRLKQLLLMNNNNGSKFKNNEKAKPEINYKDYKKDMLKKLNDRQRIKTQTVESSFRETNFVNNLVFQRKDKQKNSSSKQKLRSGSRNSITMNLNMSFVKLKSPLAGKTISINQAGKLPTQSLRNSSSNLIRSQSRKSLNQRENSLKSPQFKVPQEESINLKSLFNDFCQKKSITYSDLQNFHSLNKKIFSQFNEFISFSKGVYTDMIKKVNISECYDSKKMQNSVKSKSQNKNKKTVNQILNKIQDLYKANSPKNYIDFLDDKVLKNQKRLNNSSEQFQNDTPSSSVVSFTELHNNPEREKSYEKYRLKKLNQNLDLFTKFENKKLKTEVVQSQTTEPKVYFSKPVSTNISRKISFNNSLNNSLKNSKICE